MYLMYLLVKYKISLLNARSLDTWADVLEQIRISQNLNPGPRDAPHRIFFGAYLF
jgi:hypothetical protein